MWRHVASHCSTKAGQLCVSAGTSPVGALVKIVGVSAALVAAVALLLVPLGNSLTGKGKPNGRVCIIVGLMGSGKSYFAARIAWARLLGGGNVWTNFHMSFDSVCDRRGCEHVDGDPGCRAAGMRARWRFFTGWEALLPVHGGTVVVDEAQFYAPSNKTIAFPDEARWKVAMARHFDLDLFLVTQDIKRINGVLRDLCNAVFMCHSFFGGRLFSVRAYPPESMGNRKKQMATFFYPIRRKYYALYSTKEIVLVDGVHVGAGTGINALAEAHNRSGGAAAAVGGRPAQLRCVHERAAHAAGGTCRDGECLARRAPSSC